MAASRILVVDDDRVILDVFATILTRHGYDVCRASGSREALKIVHSQSSFDVVLSDVRMPEMLGTDLAREIAHLAPETACILMTAGVFDATTMPVDVMLLRKPLSRRDLITSIERANRKIRKVESKL